MPLAEERLRRAKGVNFIYQAGVLLDLPQITLWVAGVFFHRFYMRYSMVEEKGGIHHYVSIIYASAPIFILVSFFSRVLAWPLQMLKFKVASVPALARSKDKHSVIF
jgi:hypothetical protein